MTERDASSAHTHIQGRADFGHIRYASCWEDADILCEALNVGPGDRVLSIASAGDNALALLAEGAEVVAVDLSLPQLACLELRVAAFRGLSYHAMLGFLGFRPCATRNDDYIRLRDDLSDNARRFWDAHPEWVGDGIIHAGKFEQYFALFRRRVLPLVHSSERVEALLEKKDASERRRFYAEVWNTWRWQVLFRLFFGRKTMGLLGRDPEFFRYVDGPVSAEILRRARRALIDLPTHDNPYLTYILRGNFGQALPRYARPEHFEAIRGALDRLTLVHGTAEQAVQTAGAQGFDGFNLSDIFEYLDEKTTAKTYADLLEGARPGARIALWNMMVPRNGHEIYPQRVTHLVELSQALHQRDRAFFYGDFVVEEVR